jgi:hypothetical protein
MTWLEGTLLFFFFSKGAPLSASISHRVALGKVAEEEKNKNKNNFPQTWFLKHLESFENSFPCWAGHLHGGALAQDDVTLLPKSGCAVTRPAPRRTQKS